MPISIDSPTVLAALLGAATGAILSAVFTNLVRSWIERRAKMRETRELLAEEAIVVTSEHSSNLLEFYLSNKSGKGDGKSLPAEVPVIRSSGRLMQLQVRVWRLFPEWYVISAMLKFIGRTNALYHYFRNSKDLSDKEADIAMGWLKKQEEALIMHLTDAAKISMRHSFKIGFLGFDKTTRQRRMDVLKNDEDDDPVPWESFVRWNIRDSKITQEQIELGESQYRRKLEKLRCSKHGHAAHVWLVGTLDDCHHKIESCCEEFATLVESELAK